MSRFLSGLLILILLIIGITFATGQTIVDSLLIIRNNKIYDYQQFKKNMDERTWMNLVTVSNKASGIIELDNELINFHFSKEIDQNKSLANKMEQLNLEVALLKREAEIHKMMLEERKSLFNSLLKIIGGVSVLFLIVLVFFIDRHIRYRSLKVEMDRIWTTGNIKTNNANGQEIEKLVAEIKTLGEENTSLKNELSVLHDLIKQKEKDLDKEFSSKEQLKKEIKSLIAQIKQP